LRAQHERNQKIINKYKEGNSICYLAKIYGISRQRIWKIVTDNIPRCEIVDRAIYNNQPTIRSRFSFSAIEKKAMEGKTVKEISQLESMSVSYISLLCTQSRNKNVRQMNNDYHYKTINNLLRLGFGWTSIAKTLNWTASTVRNFYIRENERRAKQTKV